LNPNKKPVPEVLTKKIKVKLPLAICPESLSFIPSKTTAGLPSIPVRL
jgi:hypothetical protein